jgi:prepilin peptidase CpaA
MSVIFLFIIAFCVIVAIGFGFAAAHSDFRAMTIPNIYAGGIMLAFIPAYAVDFFGAPEGLLFFSLWSSHLLAAGIVFVITFILFTAKAIGAGDSKLCTAFALWTGLSSLGPYLFYMAIAGLVLGLSTKYIAHKKPFPAAVAGSWIGNAQEGKLGVPYGIAIAFGAVIALLDMGFFSPERLSALVSSIEIQP